MPASQPGNQSGALLASSASRRARGGRGALLSLSPTLRPDDVWYSSRYRKEEEERYVRTIRVSEGLRFEPAKNQVTHRSSDEFL